jgi:site-specific recombinase XerD
LSVKTARWRQLNDRDGVANGGEILALAVSFRRALVAQSKALRTVRVYLDSATRLADFLKDSEVPTDIAAIRREHVEEFFIHQLISFKPATASTRYRALQQFFKYLLDGGRSTVRPWQT